MNEGRDFYDDAYLLSKRVGSVWFAGEATDSNGWAATTSGAWDSGTRTANEVSKALQS